MKIQTFYMLTTFASTFNLHPFRKLSKTNIHSIQNDNSNDNYVYLDDSKNIGIEPKLVDFDQGKLILWRNASGEVNAYNDFCPHQGVKLSLAGQVNYQDQNNITQTGMKCSYHGLIFNNNGRCELDPQDGLSKPFMRMVRLPLMDINGSLFVEKKEPNPPRQSLGPSYPSGWWAIAQSNEVGNQASVLQRFSLDFNLSRDDKGTLTIKHDNKKVRYIEKNKFIWIKWGNSSNDEPTQLDFLDNHRTSGIALISQIAWAICVRNQLDRTHVEHTHFNTFWFIAKYVMDEKIIRLNETQNGIKWHYKQPGFYWELIFPNTYINSRFAEYAMTIIAVPINDTATKMYIRSHRTYAKDKVSGPIFDFLYNLIFLKVISEDLQPTLSQQENYLKYPEFKEKLCLDGDGTHRFFKSYVKQGFNNSRLASLPAFEEDENPCNHCQCP